MNNRWAAAILIKHIIFLGIILLSAYLTWGLMPRLQRAAWRQAGGQPQVGLSDVTGLQRQEERLMRVNLVLGVLVLALTAIARVS